MEDLSLHILDIAENSVNAGATHIGIVIIEDTAHDLLTIEVTDNGKGMPPHDVAQVSDPFFTTGMTRRVGLGLPFLHEAAIAAGGAMHISSAPEAGTKVIATFRLSHIDRKPLGDMAGTITALVAREPGIDIFYRHDRDGRVVNFATSECKLRLDGVPLNSVDALAFIREYLMQVEESLTHNM